MTLTKADLADLLYDKVGLNKREAKEVLRMYVWIMKKTLRTLFFILV